ncbi:MAG: hypothetical protein JXO22_06120, partial [Phycisphaerae bacterium]|nr:hypothetical protein [Phycisphaerae bacterium]
EETGEIVHIITLEQANAQELADTLSQIVSGSSGSGGFNPWRRGGRGGYGGSTGSGTQVTIIADAGSNSLVLKGLPRDVADVESLIDELESKGSSIPELQIFRLEYATAYDVEEILQNNFPTTRGSTDTVTVSSDEFGNRLIVTASRRKMRQVEAFIQQLDTAPPEDESFAALPRGQQLYFVDIYRGDAWDIAWDVSMMLPDNGPTVEADVFGEYIKVICRPSEKDQIVELIRQFEARAKEEKTVVIRKLKGNAGQMMSAIQAQYPENTIEEGEVPDFPIDNMIIDVWPEGQEPPVYRRKQQTRDEGRQTRRNDVLPIMLDDEALGAMRMELEALINEAEEPADVSVEQAPRLASAQDRAFGPRDEQPKPPEADRETDEHRVPAPQQRERAKITIMPDGRAVISGPSSDVDKLTDALDLLEEDLGVGEVIRIFRFKYGDVNSAAEVLDRMFNERQVQVTQRQQQQPQQQQRGQRGEEGNQNQQNLMEQMRQMIGQQQQGRGRTTSGARVRIATDPSRNYIIVKCDESDLEEIQQLLRMLDDIPDVDIKVRIFQLRNLDATETASNIKEVLGIDSTRSSSAARQARGQQQQQLMQMLEQQMVSVAGGKGMGAKIESVDIVPNVATNALLVSAPQEVMDVVEDVLTDLEALETRNVVVIRHYELKQAKVDDVLPLLQEIFADATGRQGRGRTALPSALGEVMVSGDPRSNTIIFTAESKDVEIVERQIAALDIEGMINEAETYVCKYGDAQAIADVVSAVYGDQASTSRGRGRGGAQQATTGSEIRIVAEPNTNAIVVWGPLDKREIIFQKIRDFDEQSRNSFQDIDVVHADPEDLAIILGQMFNGTAATTSGGNQRAGQRNRQAATTGSGNVVIVGDKNAKKLLVRAPELVFEQIADMVALLDIPDQQLQIRRYVLKHADAQVVKQSLDGALTEFMQIAKATGGDAPEFDAFTVVPDSRTNALMVVGSEETFTFVESVLNNIDIETPDALRASFRVFELELADATVVAEAINNMSSTGGTQTQQRGGRQRGAESAAIGTGELRVTAIPETVTNSVMVFGVSEDIDEVAATVIQPYESMIRTRLEPESIPVNHAKPSQVASFIRQFLGTVGGTDSRSGSRGRDATGTDGPHIVPNDNAGLLVVSGTPAQKDRIRMLVEKFDDPLIAGMQLKVIQIPWGQDVTALAAQVEQVVNGGEEVLAGQQQREASRIVVGYDLDANALIINGDPGLFGQADALVQQIVDLAAKTQYETVFIDLSNLTAKDAIQLIDDLQSQQPGGSRSGTQRRSTPTQRSGGSNRRGRSDATPSGFELDVPGLAPAIPARPMLTTCLVLPVLSSQFVDEMTDALSREVRGESASKPPMNLRATTTNTRVPHTRAVAAFSRRTDWEDVPRSSTRIVPPKRSADDGPRERAVTPSVRAGRSVVPELRPAATPISTSQPRETRSSLVSASAPRQQSWLAVRRDVLASIADDEPKPQEPRRRQPAAPRTRSERQPAQPRVTPRAEQPAEPKETEPEPVVAETQPATPLPPITGQLRGDVTAVELDSNKIAISGDAADLAFLKQLLLRVDAATPASEIRVFKLERAKATGLVKIIEEAVKSLIEARGTDESFSVTAEARSNSLIVAASMDLLDEVGMIIERLDARGEGEDIKTERIPLNYVRASELKAQLTPVIERLNDIREVPKESQASLQADDRSNSILIIGTLKDIEEIGELVVAYDVDLAEEGERLGVYSEMLIVTLQNGQAEDVAKVLTDMIEAEQEAAREAAGAKTPGIPAVRRLQLTAPDGTKLPALDLEKPIRLIPENGTNSIIVFSTPENNQALTAIVDVFDTLPIGADTDVRAFALKYATAEQVAEVLGQVFEDGRNALSRPSESKIDEGRLPPEPPGLAGKGLPYQVALSYDARSNTVIVIGRSDAVLLASGLIQEMDRPSAELGFAIHVIEMKNVQASELQERLTELLEERAKALGDKGTERDIAVVKSDDRSNSLIVIANDDVYQMVDDLVVKLDMAESYRIVGTQFRPLQYADAIKLQRLLEEVFQAKEDASSKTKTETTDTLTVIADARSNSLVLTGTRDYLTEAESLITDLDKGFDPTVVFKVVKVKLNSAANVAKLLKDMVDETLSDQDANLTGAPIHIAADPISDSILLAASQEDMGMIERWIEILDRPSEIGRMHVIIPLRRGRAEDIAQAAEKLFEGTTANDVDLTITSDPMTNSVVAFGPPALLQDIEDLVRQLDMTEPGAAVVRMFKLEEASAEDAGDLLRDILEGGGGTIGGSSGGGSRSSSDELKQRMLVFQASHPELGERTLQGIRDDIIVTADTRTNSLIITAPIESMPLMESLVKAIDLPPDENQVQVVRLYNSDADQMVEMLNDVFEEQTTGRSSGADSEREITLTGLGAGGRQEIKFSSDMRTNSVIAVGTKGYLKLAEELIVQLDSVQIDERRSLVYAPRNATVESLVSSLSEWSDNEVAQLEEYGDEISTQRKLEREINAIGNEDMNRVILSFDPRREAEVLDIVSQLDQAPPQVSIEVLIVEVTSENTLELGVEFAAQDLQWTNAGPDDTTTFDYVYGTDIGASGTGLGGFSFTINGRDFNFLLRTLQSESALNVLSRPHIVAMDNQEASIEITNDTPYVSSTSTSDSGQITTAVNRQDVGIILGVKPQINPDGFVRLEIKQEVSDLTDSTIQVGSGVTSPIFFKRIAETTVTVKDNETVVLGGMIRSRDERTESKVPIIGDVPVLGSLFRYDNDNTQRTELLVILTPRIIRSVNDFREVSLTKRDENDIIPDSVLTNPLMNKLRARPEDLLPAGHEELGPFPADNNAARELEEEIKSDEYGPLGNLRELRRELKGGIIEPDSYDLPVTLKTQQRAGPR